MDVVAGAREEIACVSRRALQRNLIRMIFECVSSTCEKNLVFTRTFQAPLKLFFQFKHFSRSFTCHLERMRTESKVRSA